MIGPFQANDLSGAERRAFCTRIKPEYREQYVEAHANFWPELHERYRQAGIRNLTCFMIEDLLFIYLESENYAEAERVLAADPLDLQWQAFVGPMQSPDGFQTLTEIFHLD